MKKFLLCLFFIFISVGCSSRPPIPIPTPTPIPIPIPTPIPEPDPDPIVKIRWDQDGDCVDYWIIKTSTQADVSLEDQWIEIGTTAQLPTKDNPYVITEQTKPYYVAIYAVCTNGKVSKPSNVLEIR